MARNTTLIKLLDDLRSEARMSLNPAHNAQNRLPQIKLLQRTQERLWEDFRWPHLRVERQVPVQAGQRYYAPPADMIIDNIERLELFTDGHWCQLLPGIGGPEYSCWNSDLGERAWPPRKWDIHEGEEIEIWPISDKNAETDTRDGYLKFTGIRDLRPLVADTDRADLDDRMLVLFAAAEILAGSGAKDAQLKLDLANARYQKMTGRLTKKVTINMFGINSPAPRDGRIYIGQYRPPVA